MALGNHVLSWPRWILAGKAFLSAEEQDELDRAMGAWSTSELINAAGYLLKTLKGKNRYRPFMDATIGSLRPANAELAEALNNIWRSGDRIATTNYDLLIESAALARSLGVRLHTHLCETKDEECFTLSKQGMRPLAYMEKCGWVGPDVWYAHGIHFNDDELRLLADTGTGIAHCPVSNMKLSSGVCRLPDMLRLGVRVSLAVDGAASNDGQNLMSEIRTAYLLHRLTFGSGAPSGYELLKIATRGGAAVLGRDDIGQLSVGKAGDLFLVDASGLDTVGVGQDPGSFLGTVGCSKPAKSVVVAGREVVRDGRLLGIDEEETARKAQACAGRLNRA